MPGVVHIYKDFPPVRGGIESHIATLARLLAARGVQTGVLCARRPGTTRDERWHGVRVQRCWTPATLASTPLPPALPWTLRHSGADLVHLHYPWPPGEVAWWLGGRARPLVVTVHCEVIRYPTLAHWLGPLAQRILAAARHIVVSSAALRDLPLLAAHAHRVQVIPFGVDLNHFRPDASAHDPLPRVSRPRILFVGRLRHYKGLGVLAAALARVPRAQLVVVGSGPEGGRLEHALAVAGCRERAHLLGEVDDATLLGLLRTADTAVLPSTSRAEAFGLSIAEAQACGVPAVVTDVGTGTTQTVQDGVSGRVVPPGDASALAAALVWCLDPAQAPARRTAARAHAEAALCARRMTDAVQRVYAEALDAGSGGH